jgi:SAM-dependent methyltransferase
LETAQNDGFATLHGIEPNPAARAIAGQIPGVRISADFYENTDYPRNHFDAVTLIHVLDHLFDPRVVLRRAWQHLAPGGVMMAVVHNAESLLGRVLKERFPVFNLYHHYFFSKATLAALARSCGFEVIAVPSTQNCYSAGFFVDRLPVIPGAIKRSTRRGLDAIGLGHVPIAIRIGNMGVIARRPADSAGESEGS